MGNEANLSYAMMEEVGQVFLTISNRDGIFYLNRHQKTNQGAFFNPLNLIAAGEDV